MRNISLIILRANALQEDSGLYFLSQSQTIKHLPSHGPSSAFDLFATLMKNPIFVLQAGIDRQLEFISTEPINWQGYALAFSWGAWAVETYLLYRQHPNYSRPFPPAALKSQFTDEVFQKSQRYGLDKARFEAASKLYRQVLRTVMIVGEMHPWSWHTAGNLLTRFGYGSDHEIVHSVVFSTINWLFIFLPSIPISAYSTFFVEEKHGFNKTTPKLFVSDTIKTLVIGFMFNAPFTAGFLKIVNWAGENFVPWLMTFFVIFQLVVVILFPTVIQPFFNKLSPLDNGPLRTRVEALASRLNFPLTNLYVIDGSKRSAHSNAYFYGPPWRKHIVIFDTLIKKSTPGEIEAILAHELGHWKYSHPMKILFVALAQMLPFLSAFPPFMRSWPLLIGFGFPRGNEPKPPTLVAYTLYQLVTWPIQLTIINMVVNFFSRRFEYQADQFACEFDRHAPTSEKEPGQSDEEPAMSAKLSQALVNLHADNLSTTWVDWMYSMYHHSHPTLTERLRVIEAYAGRETGRPKTS